MRPRRCRPPSALRRGNSPRLQRRHPARVQIVRLLLSQDARDCDEIVEELPLAQATVSQHLKVMKEAGLIRGGIEGLRTGYCADRERLAALHQLVGALLPGAVELSEDACGDDD